MDVARRTCFESWKRRLKNLYSGAFKVSIWLKIKLRLAQLCRQMGRDDDAHKIETELLRLLTYADEDHPILVQLRRMRAK